jgi:alginate O-acetyltransferase complex protein AlgI
MIFSSIQFIIFFLIFLFFIKIFKNHQRSIIILFSIFFYGFWSPPFTFLILFFFITSYFFLKRDLSLKVSIPVTLLPLFYFKYSFFLSNFFEIKILTDLSYKGDLPLAISFITFTAIAILVDVKTKKYEEKINFYSLSEFLIYFPQLIAGPILRAKELIPLLKNKIVFTNANVKFGILLFMIGFVKKIFFADSISNFIDPIFEKENFTASQDYIKGFLLFPLQIYFDFSGYVDMALGVSKILSIDLPINFNRPYLSSSLTEFWRNWHITLSKWFRDYVYIPLGGSRYGNKKLFSNLFLTMSIAGLWHGASINFILWGSMNGIFLFLEKQMSKYFNLNKLIKIFLTCFLVFNLWIIFRINDLNFLLIFYSNLYQNFFTIIEIENLILLALVITAVFSQKFDNYKYIENISKKINFLILIPIFIIVLITGLAIKAGSSEKFIYFDF